MTPTSPIEIPLSKKKMILALLGSFFFVAMGIYLMITPVLPSTSVFGNPTFVFITGLASCLFFGLTGFIAIKKIFDKKAGLIINDKGMIDNSNGISVGQILWSDIEDIKATSMLNQKFLIIVVKNPKAYLDKVSNPLKKNAMKMNLKSYGSPISIASNSLQINFDDLNHLLVQNWTNRTMK